MSLVDAFVSWFKDRRIIARMWRALRRGEREKIVEMIDGEFDVARLSKHVPLLAYAASWNDHDLIRRLMNKGVSVRHSRNCWVIFCGVRERNFPLIKWAVAAGLDVNRGPPRCLTPLELAVSEHDPEAVEVLLDCGASERSLRFVRWFAVRPDVARVLSRHGFYVDPVAFTE